MIIGKNSSTGCSVPSGYTYSEFIDEEGNIVRVLMKNSGITITPTVSKWTNQDILINISRLVNYHILKHNNIHHEILYLYEINHSP